MMMNSTKNKNIMPNPRTKAFKEINGKGRVQLYGIMLCDQTMCLVYNVYGYTGADERSENAARTNDIFKIIFEDIKEQPHGPVLIVGDVNASTRKISKLAYELEQTNFIDVGAQAEKYGNPNEDYTCLAHGAKNANRRDYVFANPEAFELIEDFKVDHDAGFDVHDAIKLKIKCKSEFKEVMTKKNVRTLVGIREQMLEKAYLLINRNKRKEEGEASEKKKKDEAIINIKNL